MCGFQLQAAEVRLVAYADDTAVFCVNQEVVSIAKRFYQLSASFVNWEPALLACLWPRTEEVYANIKWATTPVKYLWEYLFSATKTVCHTGTDRPPSCGV